MRAGRPEPTAFRRRLRPAQTEAERRLWNRLHDRRRAGIEFVRQETTGSYVADLCCREARSIIQVDGGQHAESTHDRARNEWLTARGYRILRVWNAEVMKSMLGLLDTILAALPPSPRLREEGGSAASPKGEGEGAAPAESRPEPPPHPRLPPRCDDDRVVASLSPQAGRGEIPA